MNQPLQSRRKIRVLRASRAAGEATTGWKTALLIEWHLLPCSLQLNFTYTTVIEEDYSPIAVDLRLQLLTALSDTTAR